MFKEYTFEREKKTCFIYTSSNKLINPTLSSLFIANAKA